MQCYECAKQGIAREAVATCNNCSVGLCADHVLVTERPVTAQRPINQVVILPIKARRVLCETCTNALGQPRD